MNLVENTQKISELLHKAGIINTSDSIYSISNVSLQSYHIYLIRLYNWDLYIVNTNPGVEGIFDKNFKLVS